MHTDVYMHIPDGFLSVPTSGVLWVVSIIGIAIALRRVERSLQERSLPLMGVMAAAIFAGQMLNFAVSGGTSGHLLGAALAVILLGPWPAVLVMASVVVVQALIFQDGGLLALGANLFNMALLGVAVAAFVDSLFKRFNQGQKWVIWLGAFCAGWTSIFVASLAAGLQLAVSGTSPANIAVPAMGGIHALIGVGEGLITAAAVGLVLNARPDLIHQDQQQSAEAGGIMKAGLILTALLLIISPLASSHPDGLEWVAEELGFIDSAREPMFEIIPDYVFPGISNEAAATIVAGIIGVIIVGGMMVLTFRRKSAR